MSSEHFERLKTLVEQKEVSRRAVSCLKDGAEVEIRLVGEDMPYRFYKDRSGGHLVDEPPKNPDFMLAFPLAVVEEFASNDSDDIGWYGAKILEYGISKDLEKKIHVKIHSGFFTLMRKGYFGMLRLGGRTLLSILKKYELHKPSRMKEVVSRLRR